MREVIGLGQLRSDACTYLERVAAGETIDVVRRGKLVAQIVSVGNGGRPRSRRGPSKSRLRTRVGGSDLTNCEPVPGGASIGSRPARQSMSSGAAGCWRGSCRPATRG